MYVCVHVINPLWNWPCNLHIQYHCRLFSWVGERVFADLCRHISENLQYTFHTQESVLWHSVAFWWTEWDNLDSLQKPCVSQSLTSPWACIITSDSLSGVVKHRETHTHTYITLFLCQRAGGMKPQTWKGTVSLTSHFNAPWKFYDFITDKANSYDNAKRPLKSIPVQNTVRSLSHFSC